jgi:hypothetical protein
MTSMWPWNRRRRRNSCRKKLELSIVVMCVLHTDTIRNYRSAEAFHITPSRSYFPPLDFHGGGRGRRRYSEDEDEEDLFQGNEEEEEEDWFYSHHPVDDYRYGNHHDDLSPPQSFPLPPPPFQSSRFVKRRHPHVVVPDIPVEIPHSQLFTTTTTTKLGKESSFEQQRNTQYRHHQRRENTGAVPVQSIWKTSSPVLVQSSALKTFAFDTPEVERVQVLLKAGHRHGRSRNDPLQARIDVWHGPDSTPQNVAIYMEDKDEDVDMVLGDGGSREDDDITTNFSAIIQTPHGYNTIAVRNTASNCDLLACVEGEECQVTAHSIYNNGILHHHRDGNPSGGFYEEPCGIPHVSNRRPKTARQRQTDIDASTTTSKSPLQSLIERLMATSTPQRIEGTTTIASRYIPSSSGDTLIQPHVHTVSLARNVVSVQVLLRTEYMRPLQARVELILKETSSKNKRDPGRVLQRTIVEVFSEDGMNRPFFAALETPKKRTRRTKEGEDDDEKKYSVSLRVVNLSGTEFPLFASVEPYVIDTTKNDDEAAATETTALSEETIGDATNNCGDGGNQEVHNSRDSVRRSHDQVDDDGILEDDWWEQSMKNSHFGGGSNYVWKTNSTILDAEIL